MVFKEKFKDKFEAFGGNLVLWGFDTERDLKLAKEALERLCRIMAGESLYDINRFLEKYRREDAKYDK